jgi:hypothetical protein
VNCSLLLEPEVKILGEFKSQFSRKWTEWREISLKTQVNKFRDWGTNRLLRFAPR